MAEISCQDKIGKNGLRPPPGLQPGDKLGIAAPASPFDRRAFEKGVSILSDMGYRPVWTEDLFARRGYLAGSDTGRARTLERLFIDPEIKAIICARGGYGSLRMLSLIDFEKVGRHPKIFVGFSDISALLAALGKFCSMVTFHGPTLTSLAGAAKITRESLAAAMVSTAPLEVEIPDAVVINPGRASGPLVGGNLTTLSHLLGTPFSPDYRGAILLLEDRGEAPYRIDRMLTQLRLAGCLDDLSGLVLGSFNDCGDVAEIHRVVREATEGRALPVLAGLPVGHGRTNLTIPLGLEAVLDTESGGLRFKAPPIIKR
jgi:muramoyltetrapeptide carboxypeptidase